MKMTGGEIVAEFLVRNGVKIISGIPGHGCLALTDAFFRYKDRLRVLQVRQEMSGVHLADGYFRASGRPIAAFTSIGPGAINTAIGLATCFVDSTPAMVFIGDVHTHMMGAGVLQEVERRHDGDLIEIFRPITKRFWRPTAAASLPTILRRAWATMMSGRKGPALVSLPMDVQAQYAEADPETLSAGSLPCPAAPDPDALKKAAQCLLKAKRPVIVAGGGALYSESSGELTAVAERLGAAVITTLAGKSVFPENHPLSAWLGGSKGTGCGNELARQADCILAVGCRFADETASSYRKGATYSIPPTVLIHMDIDPSEIHKNYPAQIGIVCDAKAGLAVLDKALAAEGRGRDYENRPFYEQISDARKRWLEKARGAAKDPTLPMTISRLLAELRSALPPQTLIATSSGNTQAQMLQELEFSIPRTCLTTGGFSTMGWSLPAAMGAKLARPDVPCAALVGDGDFLMTMQELALAVQEKIQIVVILANNAGWLSIKDLQMSAFGEERGYATDFSDASGAPYSPDFAQVAKAFGAWSAKALTPEEVGPAVKQALASGRPALVEAAVNRDFPKSGGAATGWWDVPIPEYLPERRAEYEKGESEEQI